MSQIVEIVSEPSPAKSLGEYSDTELSTLTFVRIFTQFTSGDYIDLKVYEPAMRHLIAQWEVVIGVKVTERGVKESAFQVYQASTSVHCMRFPTLAA